MDLFLGAFSEAFAASSARALDVSDRYRRAALWTAFMLGAGAPSDHDAGVLHDAALRWAALAGLSEAERSVHAQWYTLDLCLISPGYHGEADYWASKTKLAIEHENGFDVETEMWKLAHWRSELSVLIFYDFNQAELGDAPAGDPGLPGVCKSDWLGRKLEQLSAIVRMIDHRDATRHLLIIGQMTRSGVIAWRFSTWGDQGFSVPTAF